MNYRNEKDGWVPILFTDDERREIKQVGASRLNSKRAAGMSESRLQEAYQRDTEGQATSYAAEYALAKLLGAQPDRKVSITGNGGVHLRCQGLRLNAAYVSDPTYDLKYDPDKVPPVDVMVLVTGSPEQVMWLIGCISRASFNDLQEMKDYGYGHRRTVPQHRLSPISHLCNFMGVEDRLREAREAYRTMQRERLEAEGNLFS